MALLVIFSSGLCKSFQTHRFQGEKLEKYCALLQPKGQDRILVVQWFTRDRNGTPGQYEEIPAPLCLPLISMQRDSISRLLLLGAPLQDRMGPCCSGPLPYPPYAQAMFHTCSRQPIYQYQGTFPMSRTRLSTRNQASRCRLALDTAVS